MILTITHNDIDNCANKIIDYFIKRVTVNHFDGTKFEMLIPLNLHFILQARYNNKWSEESRYEAFDSVVSRCESNTCEIGDRRQELIAKLTELLQGKVVFDAMTLNDDSITMSSDPVSIDVFNEDTENIESKLIETIGDEENINKGTIVVEIHVGY